MSTRYVYGVYDTGVKKQSQNSFIVDNASNPGLLLHAEFCNEYTSEVATTPNGEKIVLYQAVDGIDILKYATSGGTSNGIRYTVLGTEYQKYIVITQGTGVGTSQRIIQSYLVEIAPAPYGAYWHIYIDEVAGTGFTKATIWNSDSGKIVTDFDGDTSQKYNFYATGGKLVKSSLLYTETSSSRAKVEGPFLSGQEWRWREYRGSDTIDPTAVNYSVQELYPGDPITITVTPRSSTYGGTVYYQYQYSTNGTTWTNIGSKTTATSAAVTIPEGAEQFQARILASDGWGFTSTTYVYGPSLDVSQMKAYATVQGVHRSISKAYAIIDGTIRSISKGYVTIDGKWKKLF